MEETTEKRGRGRPKGSKNKPKETIIRTAKRKNQPPPKSLRERKPRKICSTCRRELAIDNYYKSKNHMYADGLSPFCKECTTEKCLTEDGKLSVDQLKSVLRMLDQPFVKNVLEGAIKEYKEKVEPITQDERQIVTRYFRVINSLPKYTVMDWNDGIVDENNRRKDVEKTVIDIISQPRAIPSTQEDEPIFLEQDEFDDFEVTPEIIEQFGEGYNTREYAAMVKKYKFLSMSYSDYSSLHIEALTNYVRFKVKEEFATAIGDVDGAEKWAGLAAKAADKAKINPSQIKEEDTATGFSFSEFNAAIERAADIVTVLPRFKYMPNDSVDFLLWVYINYIRGMQGLEPVDYPEVYGFYDQAVHEYIQQYGDPFNLFDGDPTLDNRERVKHFIQVPRTSIAAFDNPDI